MMTVNTVNISFNSELLKEADRIAKAESRSRSELVREAVRQYIERKRKWDELFRLADQHMKGRNISEQDIIDEIHAYRREKRKKS